ncbi:MAG TPA: GNAT family N-acetyltransferase [Actinomycetota bacterium]|nr:GNAT family N-acetyltransferase [Actinomycetota bacterium]
MSIEVKPLAPARVPDAEKVFSSGAATAGCYCMWFIIPVTQYHAGGRPENRQRFLQLVTDSPTPIGLLAYEGGEPIGWCATGPRSRYVRAVRVPSFKGRDPSEDDDVWLVPCFYVHSRMRRKGVSRALLEGAVELAGTHGASAIEGFPFEAGAKLTRESMVGVESVFASCGFEVVRRPSGARVVMRRQLGR